MKKISNLCKLIIFISLTIFLINKVGEVFIPEKISENKYIQGQTISIKGYYELPKNTLDVLFLGDSSLLSTISPMELWNDYGIVSYNYSVGSLRTYGLYYVLKQALKYQNPKLVVIDPITVFEYYEVYEPNQRMQFDYLKNDMIKLEMINDPSFKNSFEDKVSIIFPLLRYHSRWNEINFKDLKKLNQTYHSYTKGYLMSRGFSPNYNGNKYMEKAQKNINFQNDSDKYLKKINELCKEKNIKLLIAGVQDVRTWGKKQSEIMNEFAMDNNIDYLDLNTIDYGLNWLEDTTDGGSHMNVLGAMKITKVIGDYIHNKYNVPDHRKDVAYKSWNEDYKIYIQEKNRYIEALNNVINSENKKKIKK